ncbi:MAG TPA: DUF2637 domain-containing protein [Streptosporangiaceae bacterium]|nr:DUF2637 domain-containing protein [Streptosporangiaceae bacterium]
MSDYPVVRGARPDDSHLRLRLVALTAVVVGVMLVALAAFLFSYAGIRQIALQAGVSPGLARLYPLMFDAMLIVTCSAVLATRTAGWGTKSYVWVCLLLVVAAVAVGDALNATGVHLTGQAARAAIAVVPWVLLLMGFGIWLVMLRHWRRMQEAGAFNGAGADLTAPAGRNGQAVREAPARQADRAPAGPGDRATQAMAASAAAGSAVSWAAGRGAATARTRTPRMGIDTLLEQQAGRAPERPPAADSPAASRATATGQDKQRTTTPGERQPAGTTAAAAATAAGIAAGTAAGTKAGTRGDTKPGTAGETRPPETTAATMPGTTAGTAAGTKPGAAATTAAAAATPGTAAAAPGTTAGTTPGSTETKPGTAETTPGSTGATPGTAGTGAGADAGADATGPAGPAGTSRDSGGGTGQDGGGKDKAPAQERRRRLGGLLEMPASAEDEAGSVRILPAESKAPPGDAASGKDDEAGGADIPAGAAAAAAEPDPANPPAPLPHFDRPRSTPTPPRETGADGE